VLRYRLPPRHGWPAPLEDAKAALALLQSAEASERWGIDPSRVALLGFSAGAHLAALAASPGLHALVLVYPPLVDCPAQLHALAAARSMHGAECGGGGGGGVGSDSAAEGSTEGTEGAEGAEGGAAIGAAVGAAGGAAGGAARRLPAWYVVASSNDRVCPVEETDQLCAELQRLGARCECAAPRPAYD
jgi:acetyl esterase/lipase